ncbi:hypothetical protein JSY14_11540 [Brachybacterium sp. EF45031]|uniref:hypothetical protein n=1 Tax=Brachybacterium sillae TaxID=2810536 RepID=UPI00217ED913|nr:hypothetical protein [Brachybacterium sillae]MCS6712623.1 hypothetical protein [Brachybacterium sillae]
MDSFNLGAIAFALLLLLWVAYVVPRVAERRDLAGAAQEVARTRSSAAARELTPLARPRTDPPR